VTDISVPGDKKKPGTIISFTIASSFEHILEKCEEHQTTDKQAWNKN